MKCPHCEPDDPKCPGHGLCHCGCGRKTNFYPKARLRRGVAEGDPCKFVQGHRFANPNAKSRPLSAAELKALGG